MWHEGPTSGQFTFTRELYSFHYPFIYLFTHGLDLYYPLWWAIPGGKNLPANAEIVKMQV